MFKTIQKLILIVFIFTFARIVRTTEMCSNKLISREDWCAKSPKYVYYQTIPVNCVCISSTMTNSCNNLAQCKKIIQGIQLNDMKISKCHDDIGYNFLISDVGDIFEGVGWHKQGGHLDEYNLKCLDIGFIGTFTNILPSKTAIKSMNELLKCGVFLNEISNNYKLVGKTQLIGRDDNPGHTFMKFLMKISHWTDKI